MTAIQRNVRPAPSLAAAKARFMATVTQSVEELMRRCGYSRERAVSVLVQQLAKGDGTDANDEVFDIMTIFGLGVDDAAHALAVSRAFGRVLQNRDTSVVEAIDELSSKLCVTKLLSSNVDVLQDEPQELPPRPSSPEHRTGPPHSTAPATADRSLNAQRKGFGRKATANKPLSHKNPTKQKNAKNQTRKRPSPTNEETKTDEKLAFSSRARADSVTEAVEAKAKKARCSPEEPSTPETSPAPLILKRTSNGPTHHEAQSSSSSL